MLAFLALDGREVPAICREKDKTVFYFDPEESVNAMLLERYGRPPRPIASRCPFHYHRVPGGIRFAIGKMTTALSGRRLEGGFPPWPIADGVEALRRYALFFDAAGHLPHMGAASFWPDGKRWAVALTHDADSVHGIRNVPAFLELEKRFHLPSTWFFPAAHYDLDKKLLRDLIDAGDEVACHGYNHDCRLAYLDRARMAERVRRSAEILSEFGAKGFRSPALGRSPELFEELGKSFSYDSSVPDTEDGTGCCSVFPFHVGDVLEVPITVPMDATLLLHGFGLDEILRVWKKKIAWVKSMGGLATVVTHPENHFSGNPRMRSVYAELLSHLASQPDAWVASMARIAEWWNRPFCR